MTEMKSASQLALLSVSTNFEKCKLGWLFFISGRKKGKTKNPATLVDFTEQNQ